MPTFGTPTIAVVHPDDDLVENGTRVAGHASGTRGEAQSVRSLPRLAGSLA
jgi:hypothetical protein